MNSARHLEKLEHFKAYNPTAAELLKAPQREVEEADTLTRRQRTVCLICCLIAAGIMIETLFFKFTAAPESVYIFKRMGTEPWMRWGAGTLGIGRLNRSASTAVAMGGRHPHHWRDGGGHSQSHDLAGLFDTRRSRAAVLHGVGDVHLRLHSHVDVSASYSRLRPGHDVVIRSRRRKEAEKCSSKLN